MKARGKIAFLLGCILGTATAFGSHNCCVAALTAHNVQEILDAINIIRPTIISIRIEINELLSCCEGLTSAIDNITVNVEVSGIEQIETCCERLSDEIASCCERLSDEIASCCERLASAIDNITVTVEVSGLDQIETCCERLSDEITSCCERLASAIDNITVTVEVSGLDQIQSCCEIVNSKIGDLAGPGTCLDSQIDVPEDINNLNLTVIQLLKTILLELRGCPC